MTEELVTVATFNTFHEASLAKASLEACGIPVFTADEHTIGATLYSNALGGIKVRIPASFLEEAHAVLADAQPSSEKIAGEEATVAEGHKSSRKPWVRSLIWLWLVLVAAALAISLFTNM